MELIIGFTILFLIGVKLNRWIMVALSDCCQQDKNSITTG